MRLISISNSGLKMDIKQPLEVPVCDFRNLTKTNLGPRYFQKYYFFLLIINLVTVEDIVIRSILSTKEKLQTQWKTVVVRKI